MQYPSNEQIVYIDSNYHFALAKPVTESMTQAKADSGVSNRPVLEELVTALFNAKN